MECDHAQRLEHGEHTRIVFVFFFVNTGEYFAQSTKYRTQALDVLVAAGRGELSASPAIHFPCLLLGLSISNSQKILQ